MPALSISAPRGSSYLHLLGINRHNLEIRTHDKQIELAACCIALTCLHNDSGLEQSRGRHKSTFGRGDGAEKFLSLRLREEDGGKC